MFPGQTAQKMYHRDSDAVFERHGQETLKVVRIYEKDLSCFNIFQTFTLKALKD